MLNSRRPGRFRERFRDLVLSIYLFNEFRGYCHLEKLAKSFQKKYPEEKVLLSAIEKHARDELKHFELFRHYFLAVGRMPFRIDEDLGYCDLMIKGSLGIRLDQLDSERIIQDNALFYRLCRVILMTEIRGMKQVEVLLKSHLCRGDQRLRSIFKIIQKDEPSHCLPYEQWLEKRSARPPGIAEKWLDFRIHLTLIFVKIPLLFLNPRLDRLSDFIPFR